MLSGMNGLDYAIVAVIALGALHGLTRGAVRMATSILSLALGIYAASVYYESAAKFAQSHLQSGPTMSAILGYGAVFTLVFVAIEYGGTRVISLTRIIHLNWADRLAGGAFAAAVAAILVGLALVALTAVLPASPALLRNSKLAPRVMQYNQALLGYIPPQVKKSYEEKRQALVRYWYTKTEGLGSSPAAEKNPGPS